MTTARENSSQDRLLEAKFTTTRGAEYEECLLYLAQLGESGLTVSANQDWEEGALVYLQLGQPQPSSSDDLFLTCRVQSRSRALGKLWFYELSFFRTPQLKKHQAFQALSPFLAPEGRKYYRHSCPNPFEITVRLEQSTQPVEDISCSGLSFATCEIYKKGDLVPGKVFFEDFAFLAKLRVDRLKSRGNGFFEYGCEFVELSEDDAAKLTAYIYGRARDQFAAC